MSEDDVIHMAREAGFGSYAYEAASIFFRFAALIRSAALEEAAVTCETLRFTKEDDLRDVCAAAIRAKKGEA